MLQDAVKIINFIKSHSIRIRIPTTQIYYYSTSRSKMDIQRTKFKKIIVIEGRNQNIFNRTKSVILLLFLKND